MSNGFALMIESLVAILLMLSIIYSVVLNKRLKRLRADEMALKATISELITATEIAERAIAGLKHTVRECDHGLGERLRTAERFSSEIARQVQSGEEVLSRLNQIVAAARPGAASVPHAPDAHATVRAAQAFASRSRSYRDVA